jgi:hypothetical protein
MSGEAEEKTEDVVPTPSSFAETPLSEQLAIMPPTEHVPKPGLDLQFAIRQMRRTMGPGVVATTESLSDEDHELDQDDDQVRSVDENVGREFVSVLPDGTRWSAEDRRGEQFYHAEHLRTLSPVIREIARGRIGMLAKATGVVGDNAEGFIDRTVVASPVLSELIHDGDGAGEVLIAAAAVATNALAERTAALLNEELARSDLSRSTRKARDLGHLLTSLNRSTATSAAALERLRVLRQPVEVNLTVRRSTEEMDRDGTAAGH